TDLTPREREVLAQVAQGKNNAGIAGGLHLTERAVEKHINSIFSKLGLSEEHEVHRRVKAALIYLAAHTKACSDRRLPAEPRGWPAPLPRVGLALPTRRLPPPSTGTRERAYLAAWRLMSMHTRSYVTTTAAGRCRGEA